MTPSGSPDRATWALAVDFGTTNTVASVGDEAGVRTLTIDGRPVMPSAVFLVESADQQQSWLVGESAVNMARRQLDWFEASPKRSIADQVLLLGDREIPVTDAIAAVFAVVTEEASRQFGGQPPASFVVTHPATWSDTRIQVLCAAAKAATAKLQGWPDPLPVPEPVAAAQRILAIHGVPEQCRLVVLDLGGGTVDVTVVDRQGDHLSVVGRPTGMDGLGGEDFDLRLAGWMTAEAGAPHLYDRLVASTEPDDRERAVDIRRYARIVKEQLSKEPVVPAQLPKCPPELPVSTPVQVSRSQLEQLIRGGGSNGPGLAEAVGLVAQALNAAPPGPPLGGVFLVGGSSRIPLLGAMVVELVGQLPLTHGDPSTAVADGAVRLALAQLDRPATESLLLPPPPPPVVDVPLSAPGHGSTPKRRGILIAALCAALLVGGGVAWASTNMSLSPSPAVASSPIATRPTTPIPTPVGSVITTPNRTPVASPTVPATTPAPVQTNAVRELSNCSSSLQAGCADAILTASAEVWPVISTLAGCSTADVSPSTGLPYGAQCEQQDPTYGVIWRSSLGSTDFVDAMRLKINTDTDQDFTLRGVAVGSSISGWRTSSTQGPVYDCIWEYRDYPVALMIEGTNGTTTWAACNAATFYDDAQMSAIFR